MLLGDVISKEGPMGEDRNLQVAPEGSLTQMVVNVVTRSSWKVNLEVTAVLLLIDTRSAVIPLLVMNLSIVRIKKKLKKKRSEHGNIYRVGKNYKK